DSKQSLSSSSCLLQETRENTEEQTVFTYEEKDPLPYFLRQNVQTILQRITGFDTEKISERRTMERQYENKQRKALQMPPVMQPWKPINHVLVKDEKLAGALENKMVFIDISEGVPQRKRAIVVRETDGTLRLAESDERDRILHVYYPKEGKLYHIPKMFDDVYLEKLLKQKKYKYILNSVCVQFEPEDPNYHRIVKKVYSHINLRFNRDYDMISDAYDLICLLCELHPASDIFNILPQDPNADTSKMLNLIENYVQKWCRYTLDEKLKYELVGIIKTLQGEKVQENEAATIQGKNLIQEETTFQAEAATKEETTTQGETAIQEEAKTEKPDKEVTEGEKK
ncbi:hypothetical protein KUTeg_001932, partial [Tegillarca granosa]